MSPVAVDTSVALPYLLRSHVAHHAARDHLRGRDPVLSGHSLVETYSVLTRLPGDARVSPPDAARLLDANFGAPAQPPPETVARLPLLLAPLGIAGGAVYDALVALGALAVGIPLATRDRRAAGTYAFLQVAVELVT